MSIPSPAQPRTTGVGIGLPAGADHYRAFVGPPEDYDLIAAMVFNLLTSAGLRQHHRLLDVGCGSLRIGRLLIPYLNPGNYFGVEPNPWLVQDGVLNEVGEDQIRIKRPTFSHQTSLVEFSQRLDLDYAFAQSIFSHCGLPLIRDWLVELAQHLRDTGAFFATFLAAESDFSGDGWVYPDCVKYRPATVARLAVQCGYCFQILDWWHPRQTWALFARPNFDHRLVAGGSVAWNRLATAGPAR